MNSIDLSGIISIDSEMQRIADRIAEKYKCDWDDSIHDSYERYVSRMKDESQSIQQIRRQAESIETAVNALPLEQMKTEAQKLKAEVQQL